MSDQWLLKEIRNNLGLSQERFGRLLGCSQAKISQMETGLHKPDRSERRKLVGTLTRHLVAKELEKLLLKYKI